LDDPSAVQVEADRRRAVALAVSQAGADDVVLVAGKGHEDYQEVAGQRHPMDDRDLAREALAAWQAPAGSTGGAA
ncbi:MAG TPA: UDP-N-acetylmuramoyl-L-alanyl-D-glutamate--2,6-diaminopimelate ligase, partial [Alcanivorax sp.]|nr:UDP-N-acetylmuramoyl-L-alanyl-D-glutamate--2,6-diaminopimelate ligase [Alcanivorax sp.]